MKKSLLAASVAAVLGVSGAAHAAKTQAYPPYSFTGSNFSMLSSGNGTIGGTNDVSGSWDGTVYTSCSDPGAQCDFTGGAATADANANMTLSSPTNFFGFPWKAHGIQVFGPGTYTFTEGASGPTPPGKTQTMTVGPGQVGVHMLFDWNGNNNIGVMEVWDLNANYNGTFWSGAATTSDAWSGSNSHRWGLASTDIDGDGVAGAPMVNGAFSGSAANFNLTNAALTAQGSSTGAAAAPPNLPEPTTKLGNGGCTVATGPVNPSQRADLWILSGFLAFLGVRRRKQRRG